MFSYSVSADMMWSVATTVYCILMTVVRSGYDCVLYTDDCCPQWLRLCIVY